MSAASKIPTSSHHLKGNIISPLANSQQYHRPRVRISYLLLTGDEQGRTYFALAGKVRSFSGKSSEIRDIQITKNVAQNRTKRSKFVHICSRNTEFAYDRFINEKCSSHFVSNGSQRENFFDFSLETVRKLIEPLLLV